jgi:hypothetical protein
MTDYAPLFAWVREREQIRLRKDRGEPPPWTEDPILAAYRFCNVRREDDRVTRWIAQHIRTRWADHPQLWFMLCIGRVINWPDTLAELSYRCPDAWPASPRFDPTALGRALESRARRGDKVFTGAYTITAPPTKGAKKTEFVAERTLGLLWRDRDKLGRIFHADAGSSLRYAHAALTRYAGWGPFMAYQAVVDMRFCPALLAGARDIASWAAAGPGTIRGLNRLHGRPVAARISQERALAEMLPIFERCEAETGIAIDLSDVPNLLCETDKYLRVLNGEGAPRARYVAGRGS